MTRQELSPLEMCARLNMDAPNLSNILNGKKDIQYTTLQRLARALNMKLSEVVEGL